MLVAMGANRELKAIIFDMDGVLIDSERHWLTDGRALVKRWVPTWTDKDQERVVGLGVEPLYAFLIQEYGLRASEADFARDYHDTIRDIFTTKAELLDGVTPLLQGIAASAYRLALATSSPRRWIEVVSARFSFDSTFELMVSASDLGCAAKPAPDIYERTAQLLSVAPSQCLVVEDSCPGVTAAHRAGMKVIGLRNGFNHSQDLSLATRLLDGFTGVTLDHLTAGFQAH